MKVASLIKKKHQNLKQSYCFTVVFHQINAAFVSIRDFKNLADPKLLNCILFVSNNMCYFWKQTGFQMQFHVHNPTDFIKSY